MASLYIDKRVIAILVLEDIAARLAQEFSYDSSCRAVAQLAMLLDFGLAGEIKDHQVAPHRDVLRTQRGDSVATIFARVDLAAGPDKAHG